MRLAKARKRRPGPQGNRPSLSIFARITNPKKKLNRLTRLVMNSIDFRIRSLSHLARFEMETAEDSTAVPLL